MMNLSYLNLPDGMFHKIVEHAMNSVIVFHSNGCVRYWNSTAERVLGFSDESLNRNVFDLVASERMQEQLRTDFERFQSEGTSAYLGKVLEMEAIKADGSNVWVDFCWMNVETSDGNWGFAVVRNVEQQKQKEIRLEQAATTDFLSGIGNRRQFQQVLESSGHLNICLAIIDVDHFKRINDQYGHLVGDQGIRFVAKYLMQNFESAACVARLGGEEFGVVQEIEKSEDAKTKFENFRREIESHSFSEHDIKLTVSIGLALSFGGQFDPHKLLSLADQALYTSKRHGRNQVNIAEAVLN